MKIFPVVTVAIALATLAACSKKPPESLPPSPGEAVFSSSSAVVPGSQADFVAQMKGSETIYFDTDRYDVDAPDIVALQSQARWLQRYPSKRATIEGHCDERGTREYNLGLGERRANAAKSYLVNFGIDPARLTTISYGKERPVALGSDEAAWARNRRAVTVTID